LVHPDEDVKRKVDAVIGTYGDGPKDAVAKLRNRVPAWIAAALLAVTAVATIVLIIESHRLPKDRPRPAAKPVEVRIVPEPARRQ
jgi:hypothetical protein